MWKCWKTNSCIWNKREKKPKGSSTMDNPETLSTFGTQDTERRQTKQIQNKNKTTQKTKKMSNTDPQKNWGDLEGLPDPIHIPEMGFSFYTVYFVVYFHAKCYVKMSRVIMTCTECTVGGRLSSYRLTTGAVWPSLLSDKTCIMGFQSRKIEYLEDRSTRLTCPDVRHGNHIRPVPTCLTGFLVVQLNSSLLTFYGRHHDLANRCRISVSQMTTDMFRL